MASIQSNWELNVAEDTGRLNWDRSGPEYMHLCKIELGAGMPETMQAKAKQIAALFPSPKYKLSLTYWECLGKRTDL